MLFITNQIEKEDITAVNNFFAEFDSVATVAPEETEASTPVSRYITSLATSCYAKSVDEIANTKVGNTVKRKRNLQRRRRETNNGTVQRGCWWKH